MSTFKLLVSGWFRYRFAAVIGMVLMVLLTVPLRAQDENIRDPISLAERLLGYDGSAAFPPPFPVYQAGDTATFWVSKTDSELPAEVTASLAGVTPGIYVWVEEGIVYEPDKMQAVAERLEFSFALLRIEANLGGIQAVPQTRADLENLSMLPIPDVDNDGHLYVLYAQEVNTNRSVVFNPNDSLAAQLAPGGYSNQHEMLTVNTSAFPDTPLDDGAFASVIIRQMYTMVAFYNHSGQAPWLREALSWYMLLQLQQQEIVEGDVQAFMNAPETPLTQLATITSRGQEYGAGQLFLRYIQGRFGEAVFRDLFTEAGEGLTALDRVLERYNLTDVVTNEAIRAEDVFADFVMTNVLNRPFGDGRFVYAGLEAAQGQIAAVPVSRDDFDFQTPPLSVNQLGTRYLALTSADPVLFTLFFQGQEQTPRLRLPGDGENHFYWSGSGLNESATLTREFDLSGVQSATLTFDTWYSLAENWNYAYVEVSDDDGQTWDVLPTSSATNANPYALGYGPGFTGISNPEGPRPFPYLGIGLDTNGITITNIAPDGPLANSEIRAGDTIAGYDGQEWRGTPNLLAFLANYKPGDTVRLYIQRGSEFFDADVVLGAHPTRVFLPEPLWLSQNVDLSAYAGKHIMLRFEYVSVADSGDKGIAIDNISIPEINFRDDAEAGVQGWTLNAWQQMTNALAQRFLVQYALVKADGSNIHVERLIGPRDRVVSGAWDFNLAADDLLIVAISGLNDETDIPASFTLGAQTTTG